MNSPFPSTSNHGRKRRSTLGSPSAATVREDRKVLFQQDAPSRGKSSTNSTAHEAQSIQQSLQRTQNLLQNELNRVSQVSSAIDEDGRILEETKTTHQSLDVAGAKKALTSLQRAQQQEQRVLLASILFFLAVVFYILWQRIFVKLPFVERILNMMIGKANNMFGQSLHSLQDLIGKAIIHIQPSLDAAKEYGGQALQIAEETGKELYQKVQELLAQ